MRQKVMFWRATKGGSSTTPWAKLWSFRASGLWVPYAQGLRSHVLMAWAWVSAWVWVLGLIEVSMLYFYVFYCFILFWVPVYRPMSPICGVLLSLCGLYQLCPEREDSVPLVGVDHPISNPLEFCSLSSLMTWVSVVDCTMLFMRAFPIGCGFPYDLWIGIRLASIIQASMLRFSTLHYLTTTGSDSDNNVSELGWWIWQISLYCCIFIFGCKTLCPQISELLVSYHSFQLDRVEDICSLLLESFRSCVCRLCN